jgi:hypothetical protein
VFCTFISALPAVRVQWLIWLYAVSIIIIIIIIITIIIIIIIIISRNMWDK